MQKRFRGYVLANLVDKFAAGFKKDKNTLYYLVRNFLLQLKIAINGPLVKQKFDARSLLKYVHTCPFQFQAFLDCG
jgi:hypothetical protein